METSRVRKMYDYHVWANHQVIEHLKQLPDSIFHQPITSVFSTISEVMVHLYVTDIIYLLTLKGVHYDDVLKIIDEQKSQLEGADIAAVEKAYHKLSEDYYQFLNLHQNLEGTIKAEHPRYGKTEFIMADILHHVINHGTYHRGNITAMLHQQGEKGVPTDYIYHIFS